MNELHTEIGKLINKGWDVTFMGNEDTIRNHGDVCCRINRREFVGDGYSDSPLQALLNAVDDIHEDENDL